MDCARNDDCIVAVLDDNFCRDDLWLWVGAFQGGIIDDIRDNVPKDGTCYAGEHSACRTLLEFSNNGAVAAGAGRLDDYLYSCPGSIVALTAYAVSAKPIRAFANV